MDSLKYQQNSEVYKERLNYSVFPWIIGWVIKISNA